MNQTERFKRTGEIEEQIHNTSEMLQEGIELLHKAGWYCREVGHTSDSRNKALNDQTFLLLEQIKEVYGYWQTEYYVTEEDDE